MNALDSPLDALAISYLSYGFLTAVNNIWAWVAVITAAVSFWRIRTLSPQLVSRCEQRSSTHDSVSASPPPPEMVEVKAAQPAPEMTAAACYASEGVGSPKVKFSVHYNEDYFRGSDDEAEDDDGSSGGTEAAVVSDKLGFWGGDFEKMMAARMGDMGWYRCQDLAVLDGSVVRLWDGRRTMRGASALAADGCVVW